MNVSKFTLLSLLTVGFAVTLSVPISVLGPQPVQAADITYKPVVTGAPVRRVGAGSRSMEACQAKGVDNTFFLQVLAPETIGQTLSEQPTLYWSVSKPVSGKFTVTLTEDSKDLPEEPLLEKQVELSLPAGIQTLPLAQYHVTLKKALKYKWSVSLECSTNNPSLNITASGMIQLVNPSVALEKAFKQATPEKLPYLYAENGYWYDALNGLASLVHSQPAEPKWREEQASLLKQGGLEKVAAVK